MENEVRIIRWPGIDGGFAYFVAAGGRFFPEKGGPFPSLEEARVFAAASFGASNPPVEETITDSAGTVFDPAETRRTLEAYAYMDAAGAFRGAE